MAMRHAHTHLRSSVFTRPSTNPSCRSRASSSLRSATSSKRSWTKLAVPGLNLREALAMLCAAEVARKDERRIQMGMSIASSRFGEWPRRAGAGC